MTHTWYDGAGRGIYGGHHLRDPLGSSEFDQSGSYYDGLGQLVQFERHTGELAQASVFDDLSAVIEHYRYDALGRRVMPERT